jgi:hypothetical protein
MDPDSESGSGSTDPIESDPIRIRIRNPGNLIRIQHFRLKTDPDPGCDNQNLTKNLQLNRKILFCLDQKLQFTFLLASIKDFQAREEAFIPQKGTSITSKH